MTRAVTILCLALFASAPAAAYVSCNPEGAGVDGLMTMDRDVPDALNCLGKQIASVNNRSASRNSALLQQRQIRELQDALDALARRVNELEAERRR